MQQSNGSPSLVPLQYNSAITPVGEIQGVTAFQPNFKLSQAPQNYMRRRSMMEELIFKAAASDFQKKSPCASFNLATDFLDAYESFDAVIGIKSIKSVVRAIFADDQSLSLLIRQVDGTLLIDDFDIDALLLRMRLESQWTWLLNFIKEREMVLCRCHTSASEKQRVLEDLYEKFLYHIVNSSQTRCLLPANKDEVSSGNSPFLSDPVNSLATTQQALNVPYQKSYNLSSSSSSTTTTPASASSASSAAPSSSKPSSSSLSPLKNVVSSTYYSSDTFLRCSVYDFGCDAESDSDIDTQSVEEPSDSSETIANKDKDKSSVSWRCLVGSDMAVFGMNQHPRVSLNLQPQKECISMLRGIDLWLENEINHVPEVGMCFHLDGVVTSDYRIFPTAELPSMAGFEPQDVREAVRHFLQFVRDRCTKPGHAYWLIKERDANLLKLYDLTELYAHTYGEAEEPQQNGGADPESQCGALFLQPVCLLCIRRAESLLAKYDSLRGVEGPPTTTTTTGTVTQSSSSNENSTSQSNTTPTSVDKTILYGQKYLYKAATLLHTCLRLLDLLHETEPLRKQLSGRALVLLVAVYSRKPDIVVNKLKAEFQDILLQQQMDAKAALTLYTVSLPVMDLVDAAAYERMQRKTFSEDNQLNEIDKNISPTKSSSASDGLQLVSQQHSSMCLVGKKSELSAYDPQNSSTILLKRTEFGPMSANCLVLLLKMLPQMSAPERRDMYPIVKEMFEVQLSIDDQVISSPTLSKNASLLSTYNLAKRALLYHFLSESLSSNKKPLSLHDRFINHIRICRSIYNLTVLNESSVDVNYLELTETDQMLISSIPSSSNQFSHQAILDQFTWLLDCVKDLSGKSKIYDFLFCRTERCLELLQQRKKSTAAASICSVFESCQNCPDYQHDYSVLFLSIMNVVNCLDAVVKVSNRNNVGEDNRQLYIQRIFHACNLLTKADRMRYPSLAFYCSNNESYMLCMASQRLSSTTTTTGMDLSDCVNLIERHRDVCVRALQEASLCDNELDTSKLCARALVMARDAFELLESSSRLVSDNLRQRVHKITIDTIASFFPLLVTMTQQTCTLWNLTAVLSGKCASLNTQLPISDEIKRWKKLLSAVREKSLNEDLPLVLSLVPCFAFMRLFSVQSQQSGMSWPALMNLWKDLLPLQEYIPRLTRALGSMISSSSTEDHQATAAAAHESSTPPIVYHFYTRFFLMRVDLIARLKDNNKKKKRRGGALDELNNEKRQELLKRIPATIVKQTFDENILINDIVIEVQALCDLLRQVLFTGNPSASL